MGGAPSSSTETSAGRTHRWPAPVLFIALLAWATVLAVVVGPARSSAPHTEARRGVQASPAARRGRRASIAVRSTPVAPREGSRSIAPIAPRDPGELAPSLRGTQVDGAFELDAAGRAVFGASLVRLFDYLRAATGEASDEDIRAYLESLAVDALPPEEVARVLGYYDRYLRHVDEAQAALARSGVGDDPEATLERVHALRVEAFGAEDAERAFGADERLARAILARQRIASDPTLDAEARDARLAELEATLPEDVAARWSEARAIATLRGRTSALRAEGADEARVHALRVASVGPEAADRLGRVDEARDRWAARVEAYRAELRARGGDLGALPVAEVDALRRAHFDGPELLRIAALDRLELGFEPSE